MPQTSPVRAVVEQPGAGEVAAGHALDREHLEPLAHDRAAGDGVGHVGGDDVVGHQVGQLVEPPQRHPGQDLALVGDGGVEDEVEGRDPVAGDHQQPAGVLAGVEPVEVAHLAGVEVRGALDRRGVRDVQVGHAPSLGRSGGRGPAPRSPAGPAATSSSAGVIHGSTTYVISGVITSVEQHPRQQRPGRGRPARAARRQQAEREERQPDHGRLLPARRRRPAAAAGRGRRAWRARRTSPRCRYAARRATPPRPGRWAASRHHCRSWEDSQRGQRLGVGEPVEHVPRLGVRARAAPSRRRGSRGTARPAPMPACIQLIISASPAGVEVTGDGDGHGGAHRESVGRGGPWLNPRPGNRSPDLRRPAAAGTVCPCRSLQKRSTPASSPPSAKDGRLPTPPLADWDIFPWEVVDGAVAPKVLPPPADEPPRTGEPPRGPAAPAPASSPRA